MNRRRTGGPARRAGPLSILEAVRVRVAAGRRAAAALGSVAALTLVFAALTTSGARAIEWIPPRPIAAWLPSATLAPGHSATLELVLRANGPAASLEWSITSAGNFFTSVTPSSGTLVLGANTLVRIPLTVSAPPGSLGVGTFSAVVSYANGGGLAAKASGTIVAATNGRPEIWPATPTWSGTAGTSGSVVFQIRGGGPGSEAVVLTTGKSNPDPNNLGAHFPVTPPPTDVTLPAGGAPLTVNAVTILSARAPAGSANAIQIGVSAPEGLSSATAFAIVDTSLPDSLPKALVPAGLVPIPEAPVGRDGPEALLSRNAWLLPCGGEGVKVWRASSTDSIGLTDLNADGGDDRLVGTIRIPTYAAALSVVPGFVGPAGDTLDLGLLAAGPSGLMLLDLRMIEDPPFGAWEDFFDIDHNGVDDRIRRVIPVSGFATDVAWTRSPSGRVVAFVAAADLGSNPVLASFDPALAVPGSGAGVVSMDITTAMDSLSGVDPIVNTLPTPGNATDVELRARGGGAATLLVADGAAGLEAVDVTLGSGSPVDVTSTPRATTTLSPAWGTAYARDVAWIPNSRDSLYAAVACAAGGIQVVRVPVAAGAAPTLVLAQQTGGAPAGVASAYTGMLAAAQGTAGVALLQSPGAAALDLVTTGAGAPYTAPVTLPRGAAFPGGAALEKAAFQNPGGAATALAFRPPAAGALPDLFVSDDSRVLVLRPGLAAVTGVAWDGDGAPPARRPIRISAAPNPTSGACEIRLKWIGGSSNDGAARVTLPRAGDRLDVVDVQGRVVRSLRAVPAAPGATDWRVTWDGCDRAGRRLPSGRYWLRLRDRAGRASEATPILILR